MTEHMDDSEQAVLEGLQTRFLQALEARRSNDIDGAAELLRGILVVEPRLAEPRIELSQVLLGANQPSEAEEQLREAIRILETGGQWVDDVEEDTLLSIAYGSLGEALRRQADSDEVVFGDPRIFENLTCQARAAFDKAAALDKDNTHAWYWSHDINSGKKNAEE